MKEYPVAQLNDHELKHVKSVEEVLRNETGEEVILIAYKKENTNK